MDELFPTQDNEHENIVAVVPQRSLDAWGRACYDMYADLTQADGALLHHGDLHKAREFLHPAREDAWHTLQSLIRAGAARPSDARETGISLSHLASPSNCRLLEALQNAVEAAEATDAERGYSAASGRTQRLRLLLEAVEIEVRGPGGEERL